MTKYEKSFVVSFLLASCMLLANFAVAGIRCGTQVINEGDSSHYVERECGPPEYKQQRSGVTTSGVEGSSSVSDRNYLSSQSLQQYLEYSEQVSIEEWIYNFGPNRLMQKVTFLNGRVFSIQSEGYGY